MRLIRFPRNTSRDGSSDKEFISDIDHIANNCNKVGLYDRFINIYTRANFLDVSKIFRNNAVKGFLKAADKVDVGRTRAPAPLQLPASQYPHQNRYLRSLDPLR